MEDHNYAHIPVDQQRNQPPQYPCQYCDKSFSTPRGLREHIGKIHPEVKKQPLQCHVCQKEFRFQCRLESHLDEKHSEDSPYKCPRSRCKFHCKVKLVFDRHMEAHEEKGETFKCNMARCDMELKTWNGLNSHLKRQHDRLSNVGNIESDNSQNMGDEEDRQVEASEGTVEATPRNISMAGREGAQDGLGTVVNPTVVPQTGTDTADNANVIPVGWRCICDKIYISQDDFKKHWEENHESDGTIEEAMAAAENAWRETTQGIQNYFFTSSSTAQNPNNAQNEASGGIVEPSPENISNAVSQLGTVNQLPSIGERYLASESTEHEHEDLEKHWYEDHKSND